MNKIAHLSFFWTDKFVKLKGKYTTKINKSRGVTMVVGTKKFSSILVKVFFL